MGSSNRRETTIAHPEAIDTRLICDLGEQGLLQLIQQFCPIGVVGDDAAVIPRPKQDALVMTTDVLVDGVHFSDRTTPPHSVGWRAVAANLSDLAAMGAKPIGLTVGLGLPPNTPVAWVNDLYQGMADCLQTFGGAILGGDLVRSPVRTVSITALGEVEQAHAIQRSQAKPGDVIVLTGYHGLSRAGLEVLLDDNSAESGISASDGYELSEGDRQTLIRAHQYPRPQLTIGRQAAQFDRVAGMDSSDGLADAIVQICRASGVGAQIHDLPIHPILQTHPKSIDWTLYGGEDFELVLCLPPEDAAQLLKPLSTPVQVIGQITADPTIQLLAATGQRISIDLDAGDLAAGFQHFSPLPNHRDAG
ncbi:thiamine-phosphate kinase [Alkalinema sp. FACHB-956]|uniref:thiamine-phosphate kinase n=1 Tax=Alkalinema sp. FACHB-956 TaxID=2692768 RepID=UPI00168288F2|nr:thiamine-phosphate kinase [Alkalinema sp. FACHB-956]MBD2326377.1 thiamine-phosphate kinase [Alkalinema sp. FACHB-956]